MRTLALFNILGHREHDNSGGYAGSLRGSRKRRWSSGKVIPPGPGKYQLIVLGV